MQVIYETTNLYNLKNNILPYKYIGSQQNYTKTYFGSNKELKNDIQNLGIDNFCKKILFKFEKLNNKDLRDKESELLVKLNCASNKEYYNKTNTSHRGYIENDEQKRQRIQKGQETKKKKFEKLGYVIHPDKVSKFFKGKSGRQMMIQKHGLEKTNEILKEVYKKASLRMKKNNPCKKIITDELKSKINQLVDEKKTNKEIAKILGLNFWTVQRYAKSKYKPRNNKKEKF